ncbi:hypothetical protein [Flavobacterium collinsii]|uniref:Uncharacterized protein n=1 Tax=Flavobacterium collinsii TaxID=1114861 RepID=A0A9W4TFJ6_9FLAO|nr:hypothetical protein [Flavobacterium collinsii]CAA9196471.1 hypothetical protein FLACOL7796_01187 [Flavobacterium collinsii]CAI2765851.1 conserved protein of unknown function [Flavobacterium collinsii]
MTSGDYLERVIYGLPIGLVTFFIGLIFYVLYKKKNIKPVYGVKRGNIFEYISDSIKILAYHYSMALMFIGGVIIVMALVFLILFFLS